MFALQVFPCTHPFIAAHFIQFNPFVFFSFHFVQIASFLSFVFVLSLANCKYRESIIFRASARLSEANVLCWLSPSLTCLFKLIDLHFISLKFYYLLPCDLCITNSEGVLHNIFIYFVGHLFFFTNKWLMSCAYKENLLSLRVCPLSCRFFMLSSGGR